LEIKFNQVVNPSKRKRKRKRKMEYLRQESILYFIVTPYYKERHNKAIDENVEVLKISNQSIF
jgi:hypothetical protein